MILGVQDIYYNVSDMQKSVSFYRDLLQMKVTDENPYFTGLELSGLRIGLHWTEGQAVPEIPRDLHGAHAGATLTLRVSEIGDEYDRLKAAGVKLLGRIEAAWGKVVVFEDPDGNVLKLMEPAL